MIIISNHAVDRYRKRFRPKLDIDEARRAVYAAMRERGQFAPMPPEWLFYLRSTKRLIKGNIGYLVIDEEIAMPLRVNTPRKNPGRQAERPYVAVTCLYRVQL